MALLHACLTCRPAQVCTLADCLCSAFGLFRDRSISTISGVRLDMCCGGVCGLAFSFLGERGQSVCIWLLIDVRTVRARVYDGDIRSASQPLSEDGVMDGQFKITSLD